MKSGLRCTKTENGNHSSVYKCSFVIGLSLLLKQIHILVKQVLELNQKGSLQDYLLAMERSPIRDIEIKHILKAALTDDIHSREVYMKGIDHSYYYEGYATFKAENLC